MINLELIRDVLGYFVESESFVVQYKSIHEVFPDGATAVLEDLLRNGMIAEFKEYKSGAYLNSSGHELFCVDAYVLIRRSL